MAYHQMNQKKLGKIVANHDHKDISFLISSYNIILHEALKNPLKRGSNMNMLMHLLGYFKKNSLKKRKPIFRYT